MINRKGVVSIGAPTELLRKLLARSADYAPLNDLYRSVYDQAIMKLIDELRPLPELVSILTRNSYADGSYTPGLSDIDVVVIVEDGLGEEALVDLLANIGRRGGYCRRFYPMLGELPIYTREGFRLACSLGSPLSETYAWRIEWGDETVLAPINAAEPPGELETLCRAIQVYINGFHNNLHAAIRFGKRKPTLALVRAHHKVERELLKLDPAHPIPVQGSLGAIVASVLAACHRALERTEATAPSHQYPIIEQGERSTDYKQITEAPREPAVRAVISGIKGKEPCYIMDSSINAADIDRILTSIRNSDIKHRQFRLLTASLFEFYLRYLNPIMYYRLTSSRMARGYDIVPDFCVPTEYGIERFFEFEAMHLLRLFPEDLKRSANNSSFLSARFRRMERLERYIVNKSILLAGRPSEEVDTREAEQGGTVSVMHGTIDILKRAEYTFKQSQLP